MFLFWQGRRYTGKDIIKGNYERFTNPNQQRKGRVGIANPEQQKKGRDYKSRTVEEGSGLQIPNSRRRVGITNPEQQKKGRDCKSRPAEKPAEGLQIQTRRGEVTNKGMAQKNPAKYYDRDF